MKKLTINRENIYKKTWKNLHIIGLMLFSVLTAEADGQVNISGSNVYIKGADVYAPGMQVEDEGTIQGKGNMYIYSNNIENTNAIGEVFSATDSVTIHMVGTAGEQTIGGITPINFSELIINNSNGVRLLQDQNIRQKLEFIQGLLELNGYNIDLGSQGFLFGESNGSRATDIINGGTISAIRDINNPSNRDDPNLRLQFSSSDNLGQTQIIRGHTQQVSTSGHSIYLWYTINSENTPSDIDMQIEYFDDEIAPNTGPESEFDMRKDDGVDRNRLFGFPDPASNTVIANSQDFGNMITIGGVEMNPLPVTRLSFESECNEQGETLLTRKTATEVNSDHFLVQKSDDGIQWSDIGQISAAGNTSSTSTYTFLDEEKNISDVSYYRLQQFDYDGSFDFSSIIASQCSGSNIGSIVAYPNPNNGTLLTLQITSPEQTVHGIRLFDANGSLLYNQTIKSSNNGVLHHYLDMTQYAAGVYFLTINGKVIKIVVTK